MDNIAVRTVVPIIILMGLGFFSRTIGVLKSGDERVLSSYVYYFALPALLLVNLAQITFTVETLRFMVAGIAPVIFALVFFWILSLIFHFSKDTFYLLILSTVFGSMALFGIPFIMLAFPEPRGEYLAILSVASISPASVTITITVLELYKLGETNLLQNLKIVFKRLSRNPLIIAILTGILLALVGIKIPDFLAISLRMLGKTSASVAIFMLGIFFYGRRYENLITAFQLSILKVLFVPLIALIFAKLFHLTGIEKTTLVLMHSMPLAVSMIILSERYEFHKELIASLILITSVGAGIYLNLWLLVLG